MNKQAQLFTVVTYALIVGWLSLQPGGNSAIGSYDKLAHFLTYAIFAVLVYRPGLTRLAFIACALAIVIYSGLLEFGQSFVPGRMMSGRDLIANAGGVLLGVVVCLVFFGKTKREAVCSKEGSTHD